jgi:trimeric autotransporter adhesin
MKSFLLKGSKKLLIAAALIFAASFNSVFAQPANNECTGAVLLTVYSTPGCGGATNGTTTNATRSLPDCAGAGSADDDVWYRFVAPNGGTMITVSPNGMTNPAFEVFSGTGTCGGALNSIYCDNSSGSGNNEVGNPPNLVEGATYYIRVYSSQNGTNTGTFSICVTRPAPPTNDNCSGALVITPAATCTGSSQLTGQNLVNATNSGIAGSCGAGSTDDVWYRFQATHISQTITISGIQPNLAVNGTGLGGSIKAEVFSGTCPGALTSIACGAALNTNLMVYPNNLTPGVTYYIRVFSTNNVNLTNNGNFTICVTHPHTGANTSTFTKSFINITKGMAGGTVETGDILELRAAISMRPTSVYDSCAYFDTIPAGVNYIPGSLAVLTNEGKVYKSFTDAANDDEAFISTNNVRFNLGYHQQDNPATRFRRGRLRNTHVPTVGGPSQVILVSYRVTVTAALNTIIDLGRGIFTYSTILDNANVQRHRFNANNIIVYTNTGLCSNSTGVNVLDAGLPGDHSGTFGTGNTINRVASPNVPAGYAYTTQQGNNPGDGFYTVTNNMSRNAVGYSTTDAWPKPEVPNVHRIFGVWDVIGDHTGATNPLTGNPAADTTNGATGGYMLLVNAAYSLDTVFTYPISGLCPNTYYEISFWVRNVCSRCGVDSMGRGASGVSVSPDYIPTAPGDSSGVYPNLSFSINGVNHYTTGTMTYTGEWIQKGFVFRTAPGQTNIVFAIANNAPGGGGNDWALDDIRLATCTPNLNLVPAGNSNACYGQQVDIAADVISYFDNYTYYQWQVSHNNGASFTDTLSMGVGSPTPNAGNYEYNAAFPSFLADSSQHLVQYRIRVATDPSNLMGGCSFFNSVNIIVMVNNCNWVLNTNLLSFDAALKNKRAILTWKTSNEVAQTRYEVQRSYDGVNFISIGHVNAFNQSTSTYTFTDPDEVRTYSYYRIQIEEPGGKEISHVRLLSVSDAPYEILTVVNPFGNKLSFDLSIRQRSYSAINTAGQ